MSAYAQYDDYASSEDSNDPSEPTIIEQNITYEIHIGNATFSLTDLETYDVTVDINLPETKSLKEHWLYDILYDTKQFFRARPSFLTNRLTKSSAFIHHLYSFY